MNRLIRKNAKGFFMQYYVEWILKSTLDITLPAATDFWINLILQRTSYLLTSCEGNEAFQAWCKDGDTTGLIKICENSEWRRKFANFILQSAKKETNQILDHLKHTEKRVSSLCSIGPGNGFIELYLCKAIKPKSLILIDIEETPGKHHHAFHQEGAGYCSLDSTKDFIIKNLIANRSDASELMPTITCCNPQKSHLPNFASDLTISLLSAGFHYPIESYYQFLKDSVCAEKNSQLIFDQRNAVPHGLDFLKEVGFITKTNKSTRKVLVS